MPTESGPTVSIVVPVYNNEATLKELVTGIADACMECCGGNYELLLVDDGSRDNSWKIIDDLSSMRVKGLRLSRNFGQHSALKAGFAHCRGKFIIMMDADLEDDPALIIAIIEKLREGIDICFTVAEDEGKGAGRLTSRLFHKLTNNQNPVLANRIPGTMRGFTDTVLGAILRYAERRPVYGPLITGLGFKQGFVTRSVPLNRAAQSSYSFRKRLRLAIDYLIGYTNIAANFFVFAGFIAFLGSAFYAGVVLIQYFVFGVQLPPGLSLLTLLVLTLFAILFLGIGIIGIYLQRLLTESLDRPLYLISEISGSDSGPRRGMLPLQEKEEEFNVRRD